MSISQQSFEDTVSTLTLCSFSSKDEVVLVSVCINLVFPLMHHKFFTLFFLTSFILWNQNSGLESGYLADGEASSEDSGSLNGDLYHLVHDAVSFSDDQQVQQEVVSSRTLQHSF
jgi:hypothetical protein